MKMLPVSNGKAPHWSLLTLHDAFFSKISSGIVFSLFLFGPKFHCAFAVLMGIHYTEAQNQGSVLTLEKTFALIDSIPHRVTGFNNNCNGVFCPLVELVINIK